MISASRSSAKTATGPEHVSVGSVSLLIGGDGLRGLCVGETEVVRGLSYPVRAADWSTLATVVLDEQFEQSAGRVSRVTRFQAIDGSFAGRFEVWIDADPPHATATATVEIAALRKLAVNRAGFALLHPLAGVTETALTVRHPDGRQSQIAFPKHISPGKTAKDIAGLAHLVGPVEVDIAFDGEVFEMEDQRNWSDASFKTYCRPLSAPKPFIMEPGVPLRQTVIIHMTARKAQAAAQPVPEAVTARMPEVALAHEPGLSDTRKLSAFPGLPVQARLTARATDADLAALADISDLTLELVAEDARALTVLAQRCHGAGLRPAYVVALPQPYLASHQPEGPWPYGAAPANFAAAMRRLFPDAAVGTGSLTNFTELNRCRPALDGTDFVTFGNTAIVHAADDMSVFQTLEALPHILESARNLAGPKPLRLGLLSIGMRSNPYGAAVVDNPAGALVPMARLDPRQATGFAAAYGVGVLAAAAIAGVQSLALAMPDGPLGAAGPAPLGRVIRAAARMAGSWVQVTNGDGWVRLSGEAGGLAANFGCAGTDIPGVGTVAAQSATVFGQVAT